MHALSGTMLYAAQNLHISLALHELLPIVVCHWVTHAAAALQEPDPIVEEYTESHAPLSRSSTLHELLPMIKSSLPPHA